MYKASFKFFLQILFEDSIDYTTNYCLSRKFYKQYYYYHVPKTQPYSKPIKITLRNKLEKIENIHDCIIILEELEYVDNMHYKIITNYHLKSPSDKELQIISNLFQIYSDSHNIYGYAATIFWTSIIQYIDEKLHKEKNPIKSSQSYNKFFLPPSPQKQTTIKLKKSYSFP